MNKPLKWGILGTSFISHVMADAVLTEGNMLLYSVAGRSPEPLNAFADKYQIEHIHTDFAALISDPQVDIIYIALPNHLHHTYAIQAAKAGKAILCEKSLSVDMQKTNEMLDVIGSRKVFFVEGLMYLTHPLVKTITEIISSGEIGKVRSIRGQYCAAISQFVNPQSKGALYNLGCYPASLMHLIMQQQFSDEIFEGVSISAKGRQGDDGNICESTAIFEFSNGVQCHLHTAEDYGLHAGFTVLGSTGSLELISNPWLPEAINNHIRVRQYEKTSRLVEVNADGNGFLYQARLIKESLENGSTKVARPAATLADSRAIMQLLTSWQEACK